MIFWDTSALLKLYARESDSEAYLELLRELAEPITVSELAVVEIHYALQRKETDGELKTGAATRLSKKFRSDIAKGRVIVIPSGSGVTDEAVKIGQSCLRHKPPIYLRTLDGLHLAAARTARAKGVVTTDQRMRGAAELLGLPLIDP